MKLEEAVQKRILLSPLNWGMGHVSRCIGLIRQLLEQQNEVFVACDTEQQQIFESYFDNLQFVFHEGYPFEFAGKGNFASDLFDNRKKLFPRFTKEQKEIESMITENRIDLVVSDQRYGFFSTKVTSVFVTHQLHLPLKWYQFPAQWFNKKLIANFSDVWCMDTENHSLAGKLSSTEKIPAEYIGFYSRFESRAEIQEIYEMLFVVSGPEPYAEQFFNQIIEYSKGKSGKMVCLIPREYTLLTPVPENLELVIANDWRENDQLFHQSRCIVSRAGYSTLMDLKVLGKKAVLIPTPGQEEQIYLSKLHREDMEWIFCKNLKSDLIDNFLKA